MADAAPDDPSGTLARLRADACRSRRYQAAKFGYAPLTWFLDPGFLAVLLHRLAHAAHRRGRSRLARLLMQAGSLLTGSDIQPAADLGAGLLIPSPFGTNISGRAGPGLTLGPLGGIGGSLRDRDVGAGIGLPVLGRHVTVNWFTGVQGSIRVGDGATFGPGAGVVVDVGPGERFALKKAPLPGTRPVPVAARQAGCTGCSHARWAETRRAIQADIDRWRAEAAAYAPGQPPMSRASAFLNNGVLALAVHRVAHMVLLRGHGRTAWALSGLNRLLHKATIAPASCLGDGVLLPHLAGVVLACHAGERLTIYANAICQGTGVGDLPRLGIDVMVGGHAAVIGPIHVGDGARVGPKAQALEDVPPGSLAIDPLGWAGRGWSPPSLPSFGLERETGMPLPSERPWAETRRRLWADRARQPKGSGMLPTLCIVLHRLSHACHATGRLRAARWLWLANVYLTGADIDPASRLGGGLLIPCPAGVVVRGCAGEALTIGAMAGIGAALGKGDRPAPLAACPVMGARVELAPHSGAFGAARIGDDALLQPGCVVETVVPAGTALLSRRLRVRSSEFRATAAPNGSKCECGVD